MVHDAKIKLNYEQQAIFDMIENTHGNFFITGKAGTGKSVLLRHIADHSKHRSEIVVLAPTGRAALNVGGQSSWSDGLAYVALSRCRSLDGMIIKSKIWRSDIRVNQRIVEFVKNHQPIIIDPPKS